MRTTFKDNTTQDELRRLLGVPGTSKIVAVSSFVGEDGEEGVSTLLRGTSQGDAIDILVDALINASCSEFKRDPYPTSKKMCEVVQRISELFPE